MMSELQYCETCLLLRQYSHLDGSSCSLVANVKLTTQKQYVKEIKGPIDFGVKHWTLGF
jgi:hypothetical protein